MEGSRIPHLGARGVPFVWGGKCQERPLRSSPPRSTVLSQSYRLPEVSVFGRSVGVEVFMISWTLNGIGKEYCIAVEQTEPLGENQSE